MNAANNGRADEMFQRYFRHIRVQVPDGRVMPLFLEPAYRGAPWRRNSCVPEGLFRCKVILPVFELSEAVKRSMWRPWQRDS